MNEDKENIEEYLKDRWAEQSFDVPESFIEDLSQKLDQREGRKGFFWLWLLAGLLLIGVSAFLILPNYWSNQTADEAAYQQKKMTPTQQHFAGNISGNNDNTRPNHQSNMGTKTNAEHKENKKSPQRPLNSKETSISKQKVEATGIAQENERTQEQKQENVPQQSLRNNNRSNKQKNVPPKGGEEAENVEQNSQQKKETGSNQEKKNTNAPEAKDHKTAAANQKKSTSQASTNNGDSLRIKDSVVIRDSVIIRDSVVIRDSLVIRDSVVYKDSNLNKDSDKVSFEISFLAGLGKTSTKYNDDYPFEGQEDGLTSLNTGFNVDIFYKNIIAGTGVQYSQWGESYEYEYQNVTSYDSTYISTYDTTVVVDSFSTDTTITPVIDTATVSDTTTFIEQGKNSYSWITIPLNFGYRFNIKSWAIEPRVALNFTFGIANSGVYKNPTSEQIEKVQPVQFSMSYRLQLRIRKNFGNTFIFLSPYYRSNIMPVIETPPYGRQYSDWGGLLGIGINL